MRFSILLFLSGLSVICHGQNSKQEDPDQFLMMHGIGISFQNFDGLNSRIAGFPEYKQTRDYAATLDIGSIKIHNRFISQLDLTAASSMSGDRDKRSSAIRYLGAGINFGFDLIPDYRVLLYPLAGIGTQAYQARFYKDNSVVLFNDVLQSSIIQNNIRSVSFTNSFFTYQLGLGFALRSSKRPTASIGIQAGYTGSFKDRSWKSSENQTLAAAPSDHLGQFHVSLVFNNQPPFRRK